jgi:pescadillo
MDRPVADKKANVEYVQPQYLVDSLNNLFLLPPSQYTPGIAPPAHLSPFIDNVKEGYMPNRGKEIAHLKGEEVVESDEDEEPIIEVPKKKAPTKKVTEPEQKMKGDADSSSEEESENEDPTEIVTRRKAADAKLKRDLKEEQQEMAKVLMTNRQRKLYQKAEED